jgi:hypothetical protein
LWNGLGGFLQQHQQVAGCVLGDFNAVRSQEERRSRQVSGSLEDLTPFNIFIENNNLVDLPLSGRKFT